MKIFKTLVLFMEKQVDWKLATAWLDTAIIFIACPEYSFLLVIIFLLAVAYSTLKNRDSDDQDSDE